MAAALLPFTGQGREARESLSGSVTPTVVEKAPLLHDPVAGGTCGPASSQRRPLLCFISLPLAHHVSTVSWVLLPL